MEPKKDTKPKGQSITMEELMGVGEPSTEPGNLPQGESLPDIQDSDFRFVTPKNSGVGAALGGVATGLVEVLSPARKVKAAKLAALPAKGNRFEKIFDALKMETAIGAGSSAGDLAETAIKATASGNWPLASEALASAGEEFLFSVGIGTPLRGATGLFNKIVFRPALTQSPEVNRAYDVFGEAMKAKGYPPLRLSTATESAFLDTLDNVARAGIGGAGVVRKMEDAFTEVSNMMLTQYGDMLAPDKPIRELGLTMYEMFINKQEYMKLPLIVAKNTVVNNIERTGVRFDSSVIKKTILDNARELESIGGFGEGIQGITKTQTLLDMVDNPTASNLVKLKEITGALKRSLEKDPVEKGSPALGLIEKIGMLADKELQRVLSAYDRVNGTTFSTDLTKADKAFAKYYDTFFNDSVKKVKKGISQHTGGNPEALAEFLVKTERDGSYQFVKGMKDAVLAGRGGDALWKDVQRASLDLIREQVTDHKTGKLSGIKMDQLLSDSKFTKGRIGKDSVDELFGPELGNDLREFAKALKFVQSKNPIDVGSVATSITQGGGAIGAGAKLGEGQVMGASKLLAMVVGVPWLFARVMTSPFAVKAFTKGLKMNPTNPAWPGLHGKILAWITTAQMQERRDNPPPQRVVSSQPSLSQELMGGPAMTQ